MIEKKKSISYSMKVIDRNSRIAIGFNGILGVFYYSKTSRVIHFLEQYNVKQGAINDFVFLRNKFVVASFEDKHINIVDLMRKKVLPKGEKSPNRNNHN